MANQGKPIKPFGKQVESADNVQSMLAALQSKSRSNPMQGVIKDSEGKVASTLQPNEQARYAKIFEIAKKVIFPGPETGQLDSQVKAQSSTPMSSQMASVKTGSGGSGSGGLGGLGALALIPLLGGLAMALSEVFEGLGMNDSIKSIHNIIKAIKGFSAVKTLSKFLKPLTPLFKFLKTGLQAVGSGIAKVAKVFKTNLMPVLTKGFDKLTKGGKALVKMFDGKAMQGLVKAYGKVVGVGKSIASFFGGPMGTIGKGAAALGKAAKAGGLMKMFAKVGAKLGKMLKFLPFVGSIFSFMASYQAFKDGRYGRGILELLSGVLNFVPGIGNVASGLLDGAMLLYDLLDESGEGGKDPMQKFGDLAAKGGAFFKNMGIKILEKIKGIFGGMGDWLVDKAMGAIEGVKSFLGLGEDPELKAAREFADKQGRQGETDVQLANIREKVGNEEFRRMMGQSPADRQDWLASQGFIKKINDGMITQNGISTRIDSQDQVLAMKEGGPIDKAFGIRNGLIEECKNLNMMQVTLQTKMLAKLEEIARNTGGSGGSTSQPVDDTLNEFTNLLPVN